MATRQYYKRICEGCKLKAKDRAWHCELSCRNLGDYNDIDECVNHSERVEDAFAENAMS